MTELKIFDEKDFDHVAIKEVRKAGGEWNYPQLCLGKELKVLGLNIGDRVFIGVVSGKYIIIRPL